jgi:hypothetical protein
MFKPKRYKYEPMSIRRQRELAKFDTVRDQISPLVAKGDPLSLMKAQQALRQSNIDKQKQATQKRNWMTKVGESVKKRLEDERKANSAMGSLPPEVQGAADRESNLKRITKMGPVPGVPLGVAEAFPEKVTDETKRYKTRATDPLGYVGGQISENLDRPVSSIAGVFAEQEGGPGPAAGWFKPNPDRWRESVRNAVRGAMNPDEMGFGEAAALRPLPEGARGPVGGLLDTALDPTNLAPLAPAADIPRVARGGVRAAERGAIAYRDLTKGIPVGASIKDVSGALPDDLAGGAAPSFVDAVDQLRSAVRTEAKLRNSGVVEQEIRRGRGAQFGGVRQQLEQGVKSGLSGEELARQARSGAAVGGLRRTVAEPVQLSQAQRDALFDEVMTRVADPEQDAALYLQTTRALQKALDGEGLQPHEIRALQPLLGHDMATALAGRAPQPARVPMPGDKAGARGGGPRLPGQAALPAQQKNIPTVGRGRPATAEGMGDITKGRIADEAALKKQTLESLKRTAPDLLAPVRPEKPTQFPSSTAGIPTRGAITKPGVDPHAEQSRVAGIKKEAKSAAARELKANGPTEEALMAKVDELLATETRELNLPGNPTVKGPKAEVGAALKYWLEGNRDILDNMGPEGNQLISNIGAQLSGNVADSYLTAALSRKNILATSLRDSWGEVPDAAKALERDKIIDKVTTAALERELKVRYGHKVPAHVRELLKTTRPLPYEGSLGALSTFTQRAKNSMFGILDVGVFGVQGLNAIRRGGVPLMAAQINRGLAAMHMPNVATHYADGALSKQVQYGLDGVKQGAVSGAFSRKQGQKDVGSLFAYLGKPGRAIDRPYMAAADKMSQWQFGTVLGGLRNSIYEGDLVMAHLLKQDISDAAVRKAAADNANAIGSFAENALRRGRAQKEGVLLLSAPMTRARINQIRGMARVFSPKATPTERIVGSMMIASSVGYTLAVGKLLNDYIGVGDFEMMPDKPGFGQITTAYGRVIDVIPQDSIERAFAKSVTAIMEADPKMAAEAWGNVFIGSSGPVPQMGMAAFDVGYEPGKGYRYGDLGGNRLLNLAPLPPSVRSLIHEGVDPMGTPLQQVGIGNFEESAFAKTERVFEQETGKKWRDVEDKEQTDFRKAHPDLDKALDDEAIARGGEYGRSVEVTRKYSERQKNRDAALLSGAMARDEWKNLYQDDQTSKAAEMLQIWGDEKITKPKNPRERYIQILQQAEDDSTGAFDFEKMESDLAALSQADRDYIDRNVGLSDTPIAAVFRDVRKTYTQRNELPKYRGFTAEQAQDIDEVWQEVRNNARSADRLDMLRALRYYLGTADNLDGAVIAGVRKRINQHLSQLPVRERFSKAHPELNIFYGNGKLTKRDIDFLNARLAEA